MNLPLSDQVDNLATLCLDTGLALRTLHLPVECMRDLLAESTRSHAIYNLNHVDDLLGDWQWSSCAGPVRILAQNHELPELLSIDSRGMVNCGLNSAHVLLLLSKLLRLKIYDPSPV